MHRPAGIDVDARAPNPVVTPYTTAPSATSAAMTSRASCMRSRAWTSSAADAPWRATASTSAIVRSAPVRTMGACDGAGSAVRVEVRYIRLAHRSEDSRLCSAAPTRPLTTGLLTYPPRGLRARVHRRHRHPVPEQPVRRRRLHRRDGRHGHRVGDDPAAVRADPPVRRISRIGPFPARAAHRPALELLAGGRSSRRSATRSDRSSRMPSARTAAARSSSATESTCSSGRTRSRPPTGSSPGTVPRPSSSGGCCQSFERSSASRPAWPGCGSRRSSSIRRRVLSSGRRCSSTRARSSARTGPTSGTRCSRSTLRWRSVSWRRLDCSSGGASGCLAVPAERASPRRHRPPETPPTVD